MANISIRKLLQINNSINVTDANTIANNHNDSTSTKHQRHKYNKYILPKIKELNNSVLKEAADIITEDDLMNACYEYVKMNDNANSFRAKYKQITIWIISLVILIVGIIFGFPCAQNAIMGIRCFVPNNYIIWEASRPITDCNYCRSINRPIILFNATQDEFSVILNYCEI